jgi:hypothetical protein
VNNILAALAALPLIVAGLAGLTRYLARPSAFPGPGGYAQGMTARRGSRASGRSRTPLTAAFKEPGRKPRPRLLGATAGLVGRAARVATCAGRRLTGRGGQISARAAGRSADRLPWPRRAPSTDGGQAGAATRTRRADGKAQTPADRRFFGLRQAGYRGPIDQDGRPVTSGRAADILASLANLPAAGAGGTPAEQAARPAAPTAPDRARRDTTMTRRYSMSLERPSTDAEFLESCVQLGDALKGLAGEVADWAEGLSSLHLPPAVLNPLQNLCEGIEDAATGAAEAATAFEDEFEEARDVASRGMHFTGEDAA